MLVQLLLLMISNLFLPYRRVETTIAQNETMPLRKHNPCPGLKYVLIDQLLSGLLMIKVAITRSDPYTFSSTN
uniref:Putative secreted peptide n=1 Tax=Anopheles braziliensis TaxID=58242 RepID=A0A2M3ZT19_9DIPT